MPDRLLYYTTQVPAEETANEIISMLAAKGATRVMMDFGENAQPVGLKWRVETGRGSLAFGLPIRAESVFHVLTKQRVLPSNPDARREQAERTAWRIVKGWIAAQMALIETEMVVLEEVFLPYMLTDDQTTLYQAMLVEGRVKMLPPGMSEPAEHV